MEDINYGERRARFMETFGDDPVLTDKLPKLAIELFKREFGITIEDISFIPIAWATMWQKLMVYLHSQPNASYSVKLCGFTLEYTTNFSQSDKSRNIVPELYHDFIPIFKEQKHETVTGEAFNQYLAARYNDWRTVNQTETIDLVERQTFTAMDEMYGINLMITPTVLPLFAAVYTAGVTIARESGKPVNMYNWFTITAKNDNIILTPLAAIKQGLKDDGKK